MKLVKHHLWNLGLFSKFGFFYSGLQNRHLQENSALETNFFWNFRHIPTTLSRLEFTPQVVQKFHLAPGQRNIMILSAFTFLQESSEGCALSDSIPSDDTWRVCQQCGSIGDTDRSWTGQSLFALYCQSKTHRQVSRSTKALSDRKREGSGAILQNRSQVGLQWNEWPDQIPSQQKNFCSGTRTLWLNKCTHRLWCQYSGY